MSFPGGSPDEDAMSAKGRWASKKIGFGQGSFEDGAGLVPEAGQQKNQFRPRVT